MLTLDHMSYHENVNILTNLKIHNIQTYVYTACIEKIHGIISLQQCSLIHPVLFKYKMRQYAPVPGLKKPHSLNIYIYISPI